MRIKAIQSSSKVCHFGQTCTLHWCFIQEPVLNFRAITQSQGAGTQVQTTGSVDQRFNKRETPLPGMFLSGVSCMKSLSWCRLGWGPRWDFPGMVLHSSWFTEKDLSEQLFNPRAEDRYSLVRTETHGIRWEAFLMMHGALLPQEKGKQVIKWPGRPFTEKNMYTCGT